MFNFLVVNCISKTIKKNASKIFLTFCGKGIQFIVEQKFVGDKNKIIKIGFQLNRKKIGKY